ncbi:WhiB family transcriptional regulator [Streptomyces antibioticus]|uniref:WhiB family transcriptional regulator n=1 Tax=Streptomyces antibioticus TaxID=1890 RepID=UPI0036F6C6AC
MTAAPELDEPWQLSAACSGLPTEDWFPQRRQSAVAAVAVCAGCPVRVECLYDALRVEAAAPGDRPYGIRGGLTASERRRVPPLPRPKATALAAVRDVLAQHSPEPIERITMTTAPAVPPAGPPVLAAVSEADKRSPSETLPLGQLLKWADSHADESVRDQSARARAVLAGLRRRYDTDKELASITSEADQLEKRLAELRAREAELVPAKAKKARQPVDYPPAEVRAWAAANGRTCPAVGRVPKAIVDAWRAATGGTA